MIKKKYSEIANMLNVPFDERFSDVSIQGVSIDTRAISKHNLFIPLKGERVDSHLFVQQAIEQGAAAILWNQSMDNPPTDFPVLLVEDTLQALSDLAHAYALTCHYQTIAITGSNGKTSTKDLIAGVLSEKYKVQKTLGNHNNEIGVPLTLLEFDEDCEIGVVEMGMENLGEIRQLCQIVAPNIGIITNVGVAHLENLGSLENIAKAKCEMIEGIVKGGSFFYNGDDAYLLQEVKHHDCSKLNVQSFGKSASNDCQLQTFHQNDAGIEFKTSLSAGSYSCDIYGEHQALNACAAILCAQQLGLSDTEIVRGFKKVEKTGMRNELEKINQATILNDAYKSNPQSALAALHTFEAFESPYRVVVLGDMLELGETSPHLHEELGRACQNFSIDELYCIGEMAQYIARGAKATCKQTKVHSLMDKQKLIEELRPFLDRECLILVKGSRGMKLDEVIAQLKEKGE